MRALEVENNLNLKAVQLTKSGLRVFGFCPAGATKYQLQLVPKVARTMSMSLTPTLPSKSKS